LRQILGICSSLAVTNLMFNSLIMGLGLTFTTALSSLTLSLMRNWIPHRIRMIVQTLVIAAYVILVDITIKATLPDISKALGPYVGLIITNCIIMGRAEAYAQKNPPLLSMLDGLFAGVGYTRCAPDHLVHPEILGFGTCLVLIVNFIALTPGRSWSCRGSVFYHRLTDLVHVQPCGSQGQHQARGKSMTTSRSIPW
jgi:Na+-transporting NADH:ubiquinone oxidoreductase subunit D